MLKGTSKWRLAGYIAHEADSRRIESSRHFDARPLSLRQNRLKYKVLFQDRLALTMNVAYGGADLRVGIGLNVFQKKIDEPSFALEKCQKTDGSARRFWRRFGYWRRRYQQLPNFRSKVRVTQCPPLAL